MAFKKFFKKMTGNVLYYPGCLTKGVLKTEFKNYTEIFNKLGIDYILMPNEVCCGLPIINAGYKKDAKNLAQKNLELFKKRKVYKIITNCPSCYHTFKTIYPKLIKEWDIEAEHATQTILNRLKKKKIKILKEDKEIVSYHDPCHLGRYSEEYTKPRKVIQLLGSKLVEPIHTKEKAFCCGGGGGLRANHTKTSKKIAKIRATQFPKEAKKIITPCGLCYSNLSEQDERTIEFSTYVLGKLRGLGK
jgi:Fe-S oxidoreductase